MEHAHHIIVGFDLRKPPNSYDNPWEQIVKGKIDPMIVALGKYSVDPSMWPRVLSQHQLNIYLGTELNEWYLFREWEFLLTMLEELGYPPGVRICITSLPENARLLRETIPKDAYPPGYVVPNFSREGMEHLAARASVRFLGFDIADVWLYTYRLMNPRIFLEQNQGGAWCPAGILNEYRLISSIGNAVALAQLADKDAPEHAPFFPFALWQIEGK